MYSNTSKNINVVKDQKYLVIYDSLSPNNNVFLEFHSVDSDIKPPINGWKYEEVPFPIDSVEIRKYMEKWK